MTARLRALAIGGDHSSDCEGVVKQVAATVRECPASFAQRRLWFFEQIESGSSVLHNSFTTSLTGSLDVSALERAFDEVQRRHETLRTSFADRNGEPVQVISEASETRLPLRDLRTVPDADRRRVAERIIAETKAQTFDLQVGPLWRALLIRMRDDHWKLLVVVHHLVTDGQSTGVFQRELGALYLAFSSNRPSPLPRLPWQYGDFSAWQRETQDDSRQTAKLAYWIERLRDAPPVLDLPTDFPRTAAPTFNGSSVRRTLDLPRMRQLEGLGRRHGASLFMVLLAGFSALVSRLSGQTDVVVGTPIAGRLRADVEPLIGLFINTLPLRVDVSGNPAFEALLERVKTTAFDALEHQDVPFERIVAAVRPQRARSHAPLFQVLFNMQELGGGASANLGGVVIEPDEAPDQASKFDLTVYASRRAHGIELALVYNPDLFEKSRIVEMAAQYEQLLTQVVGNPQTELAAIDLRTPGACLRLPDPTVPLSGAAAGSIVERLREHARSNPERAAVVSTEGEWTYRDLDRRTDVLAARLREDGIGAGDVVAIYAHRSAPLVLSLLGIMKAGAAFCILDPRHPAARLSACIRAAKPACFIHVTRAGEVAVDLQVEVDAFCRSSLQVGDDYGIAEACATPVAVEAPLGTDRLAYVAFTSGSTGGVKAVAGCERPLVHFLDWHARTFGLTAADSFSVLSGLAHDPLLRDILTPLWVGGRLEMPPDVDVRDADATALWLAERHVSVAHLTPPMARLLSDAAVRSSRRFPTLRHVFFAGDALTPPVVGQLRTVAPHAECVNFYGATETPQAMGFCRLPAETPNAIALGRGIDDVQLLVMGENGRLAGVGEPGEIWIRTPYLSQGYLNDPELTRARFVQNPFTSDAADRVYRSGDTGRYRPDGSVEFVGRGDLQIKIRGFRVELQEVERALLQHPSVADAVTVSRTSPDGDRHLVAYCVYKTQQRLSASALRSFLKTVLPEYAIPAKFEFVAHLPLTANGKIDRAALPAVESSNGMSEAYVAPRSATERELARIWSELLGMEHIGIHDGFFDCGGHSLLAMQVMSRVREQLGVEMPLRTLFEFPTIEALAGIMDQQPVARPAVVPGDEEREEIEF